MSLSFKKIVRLISLLIISLSMTACVTNPLPLSLYGNYKGSLHVFPEKIGNKMGKSCYTQFGIGTLPLFLIGDGSVKSAADNGGITKVSIVDFEQENIATGIYARTCIVVYGE